MLDRLRIKLASANALLLLSLMAIPTSIFASTIVLSFWWVVETLQPDPLSALSWLERLLLPTIGGIILGGLFYYTPLPYRAVGVVHVMERLAYHQGYLPLRNALQQFVGAAISLSCGHSVGREGPSVHLGAASGSLLGQWLSLPNNSIRVLVACGTAAAIAASFNTPLAGVIFAMEVVMMEYTVVSFTPVILAAVIGAVMTRWFYSDDPAFIVPPLEYNVTPLEVGYFLLVGIVMGCLAAAFNQSILFFTRKSKPLNIWLKFSLAGFVTGGVALFVPQVMGIGYDSVTAILSGQMALPLLLILVVAKLAVTTFGIGLGLPAGLIGPTFFIGAMAGGAMGMVANVLLPADTASSPAFYAMLGMGAMMGATLQAPLAALTALMELTLNPNLIMPSMLVIVIANLVAHSPPFKRDSIFLELMRARGLDYRHDPVAQSLRRVGVAAAMDTHISVQPVQLTRILAQALLEEKPQWVLIEQHKHCILLLQAVDLARFLQEMPTAQRIDLLKIPAKRLQAAPIALQASLQEALEVLQQPDIEALYVTASSAVDPQNRQIYGVLTAQDIEENY